MPNLAVCIYHWPWRWSFPLGSSLMPLHPSLPGALTLPFGSGQQLTLGMRHLQSRESNVRAGEGTQCLTRAWHSQLFKLQHPSSTYNQLPKQLHSSQLWEPVLELFTSRLQVQPPLVMIVSHFLVLSLTCVFIARQLPLPLSSSHLFDQIFF